MASVAIEDAPGGVGTGAPGSSQITLGVASWEYCDPRLDWSRGSGLWSPGALSSSYAAGFSLNDWIFIATHTMVWFLNNAIVRHEVRTAEYLNGSVVSDTTQINYASGILSNSAISSQTLTTSQYTAAENVTYTPPTFTAQRPDSLVLAFRYQFFDQSTLAFDTFQISSEMSLSSVYRGTRDVGGIAIPVNGGRDGAWLWDIYRSALEAWQDCSGGGGGDSGGCTCESWTRQAPCAGDTGSRAGSGAFSGSRRASCSGDVGGRRIC